MNKYFYINSIYKHLLSYIAYLPYHCRSCVKKMFPNCAVSFGGSAYPYNPAVLQWFPLTPLERHCHPAPWPRARSGSSTPSTHPPHHVHSPASLNHIMRSTSGKINAIRSAFHVFRKRFSDFRLAFVKLWRIVGFRVFFLFHMFFR